MIKKFFILMAFSIVLIFSCSIEKENNEINENEIASKLSFKKIVLNSDFQSTDKSVKRICIVSWNE